MDADGDCYVVLPWMEEGENSQPPVTKFKSESEFNESSCFNNATSIQDEPPADCVEVKNTPFIKEEKYNSSSPDGEKQNDDSITKKIHFMQEECNDSVKFEKSQHCLKTNKESRKPLVHKEEIDHPRLKKENNYPQSEEGCSHSQSEGESNLQNEEENFQSQSEKEKDHSQSEEESDHSQSEKESDHSLSEKESDHSLSEKENDHSQSEEDSDHSQSEEESVHSQSEEESDHSLRKKVDKKSNDSQEDEESDDSKENDERSIHSQNDEESNSFQDEGEHSQDEDKESDHSQIDAEKEIFHSENKEFGHFLENCYQFKAGCSDSFEIAKPNESLNKKIENQLRDDHPFSPKVRARKKCRLYSEEELLAALNDIKNNGISVLKASTKYGVSNTILIEKINSNYFERKSTQSALTDHQEKRLYRWTKQMCDIGYGKTRKELPKIVKELLESENVVSPIFTNNQPSRSWVYKFISRFPELYHRTPEQADLLKSSLSEYDIKNWFNNLEKYFLEEHKIIASEFLCEANNHRIFNCDERGFPFVGSWEELKTQIYKGRRNAYHVGLKGKSKQQLTVIGCVAANGHYLKPFVIIPGNKHKNSISSFDPSQVDIFHSPNGWMSPNIFYIWLSEYFYEFIKTETNFPVILFLGGYYLQINLAAVEFCFEHNIILCSFPPYGDVLQPLDVSVYGPLKSKWNDEIIRSWAVEHKLGKIRHYFLKIFLRAWKLSRNPEAVKNAFKKSGLVPFRMENFFIFRLSNENNSLKLKGKSSFTLGEKMGIKRCMNMMENLVPKDVLATLKKRLKSSYNERDDSLLGTLWELYKNMNLCLRDEETPVTSMDNIPTMEGLQETFIGMVPPELQRPLNASAGASNILPNTDLLPDSDMIKIEPQYVNDFTENSTTSSDSRVLWNLSNAFSYNYSGSPLKEENEVIRKKSKKKRKKRKREQDT